MKTAIFVSGSGTNCENLIRHFQGSDVVEVVLVLSNHGDAGALARAKRLGVPTEVVNKSRFNDPEVLLPLLKQYGVEFIVLAGFLLMVPPFLLQAFPRGIINLHPALLPRHGGKGMWGMHVHRAVKAAGDTESGMTVHWVSEVCDGGEIIAQFSCPVYADDTPEDIAAREHVLEMEHFPAVVESVISERMSAR